MKKLLLIVVTVALALGIAVPALAGTGVRLTVAPAAAVQQATTFELNGQVGRVFATAGALKVQVRVGSLGVRPFIGRDLSLRVGKNASLLSINDGIAHAVTLAQIKAGQQVHIEGFIDRSAATVPVYVATVVHVRIVTPPAQLTEFACGGVVTAVDASDIQLTVASASRALWASIGSPITESVSPNTDLFKWVNNAKVPIALTDLAVGDHVWTRGTIDHSQTTPAYSADVVVLRQAAVSPTAAPVAQP